MKFTALSDGDLERIHNKTLEVLAEVGVFFGDNEEVNKVLSGEGCNIKEGRAYFPPEVVEKNLAKVPDRKNLTLNVNRSYESINSLRDNPLSFKKGQVNIGLIGNPYYIYDYEDGEMRECNESDVEDKLLILDNLDNIDFDYCNLITAAERYIGKSDRRSYQNIDNCHKFLQQWVRGRAGIKNNSIYWTTNMSPEEQRLAFLGMAIIEGKEAITEIFPRRSGLTFWCNPLSPLKYKPEEAHEIVKVSRHGGNRGWVMIAPEVMLGLSGPVTISGALIQHNAEVLAGVILAQMAKPGANCMYGSVSAPADLRNAQISQGNFETAIFNAAVVQLADKYGLPSRISPGNTSARKPCSKAAVEQIAGLIMGASAGGNLITTGLLDSTLMISYEHLILLDELIEQTKLLKSSVSVDEDSMAIDTIRNVAEGKEDFISCDHTYKFMKKDIYLSDFCGRLERNYKDWYDIAHIRVKDILKQRSSKLNSDIKGRLESVVARLKEDDSSWLCGSENEFWGVNLEDNTLPWQSEREEWWSFYLQDLS